MSDPLEDKSEAPVARTEADSPRTTFIFLMVLASAFVLTGIVLGVDQYFELSVREEIENKVLKPTRRRS